MVAKIETCATKSDSLLDFIHQVKTDLMMMADGVQIDKDTVNRHILQKKDNIDIASQYFIGTKIS